MSSLKENEAHCTAAVAERKEPWSPWKTSEAALAFVVYFPSPMERRLMRGLGEYLHE